MMIKELEDFRTKRSFLLDTCFIVYELVSDREKELLSFCSKNEVLLTSFNLEELNFVSKKLGHNKRRLRDFLKKANLHIVNIPFKPGDFLSEKKFVKDFDASLLSKIHDPSDAILVVAAIRSSSDILTRDKHHLFTRKNRKALSL